MHINCPHCQNPIEIVGDQPAEVVCPSCGSSIMLDPGKTRTFLPTNAPRRLGKYELIEQIGMGGFGTVCKARDTELDRIVAIKIPRAGNLSSQEDVDRFLREARSAAQLRHPGIVSVFDASQADGTVFLVSEYVQGATLSDRLGAGRLTFRRAAELIAEVADALHVAHQHGVIHRDIKPSNIMIDLDGRPHVMDFGLAKRDAGEITMTLDGQVLGTPAYMPPEQARGEGHSVDARGDVYSLGVILYELLTGELPFRGNNRMLIVQVLQDEPRPPRRINDKIPRDLETICLKAMSKVPARRYATARELADDLRRWLAGEPIQARRISLAARCGRWCRRNRMIASLILIVASVTLLGFAAVTWQWRKAVSAQMQMVAAQTQRAVAQIEALRTAAPESVSVIIANLAPFRREVTPHVLEALEKEPAEGEHIRLSLFLLPQDPGQADYLGKRLLDCPLDEFRLIRDYLKSSSCHTMLIDLLWEALRDSERSQQMRFHAGMALADYAPDANDWTNADAVFLVEQLLSSNPEHRRDLRSALSPIAQQMLKPLERAFVDRSQRDSVRESAAIALADYARDDLELLAKLISEATPQQMDILFPLLVNDETHSKAAVTRTLQRITLEQPAEGLGELQRVDFGQRRARAAITLMRMGEQQSAFEVFRVREDPESLTQFVHQLTDCGLKPDKLLICMEQASDDRVRVALLLGLGEFGFTEIPESQGKLLIQTLLDWYRHDPSSAVHGACGWLLRNWGFKDEVAQVDQTPVPCDPAGTREWFVQQFDAECVTFVVFPPGDFVMGSPLSERDRFSNEPTHSVRLDRLFALADREVTRGQFEQFLQATRRQIGNIDVWSPSAKHPVVGAMWYEVVLYCRWLTEQVGMTEADQCYEDPEKLPKGADGFPISWPFHPERAGFRLPSEAEWEYACRSGTITTFSFGSDRELLGQYAWFLDNSGRKTHPGAELRPNLRGLFDMHGNVIEWCHDWMGENTDRRVWNPIGPDLGQGRVIRGGAWGSLSAYSRSAFRDEDQPTSRLTRIGLRLARTIPGRVSHL